MELHEAKKIVTLLSNGLDPITGEVYEQDSPYQQAAVVRALHIALQGIERLEKRKIREHKLPTKAGKSWTEEEDTEVIKSFEAGESIKEIATRYERTTGAIRSRLIKLGVNE